MQILVSIQGLILGVEHPFYMEPGYGGWEASHNGAAAKMKHGGGGAATTGPGGTSGSGGGKGVGQNQSRVPTNVRRYEDTIRAGTMKYAIAEYCRDLNASSATTTPTRPNYLSAFEDIIRAHFWRECKRDDLGIYFTAIKFHLVTWWEIS